jgi:hypothetical protein
VAAEMIQSDPHGDMGSWAEMTWPTLYEIEASAEGYKVSNKSA